MTIERAAKAIAELDGWAKLPVSSDGWAIERNEYLDMARAALNAIAEPTPEMIEAGVTSISKGCDITPEEARIFWRAAHAVMLKDSEHKS